MSTNLHSLKGRRKRKKPTLKRNCRRCGKPFETRRSVQVYCRAKCRQDHYDSMGRILPAPTASSEADIKEAVEKYLRATTLDSFSWAREAPSDDR